MADVNYPHVYRDSRTSNDMGPHTREDVITRPSTLPSSMKESSVLLANGKGLFFKWSKWKLMGVALLVAAVIAVVVAVAVVYSSPSRSNPTNASTTVPKSYYSMQGLTSGNARFLASDINRQLLNPTEAFKIFITTSQIDGQVLSVIPLGTNTTGTNSLVGSTFFSSTPPYLSCSQTLIFSGYFSLCAISSHMCYLRLQYNCSSLSYVVDTCTTADCVTFTPHSLAVAVEVITTAMPTVQPTRNPTFIPTFSPSYSLSPSKSPSFRPTVTPSITPSYLPTIVPSPEPSHGPTENPTFTPTQIPTSVPTEIPTNQPTYEPTFIPTSHPSISPTKVPTVEPTKLPTFMPTTTTPTLTPTIKPSSQPSYAPTSYPTSLSPSGPVTFKATLLGSSFNNYYIIFSVNANNIITSGQLYFDDGSIHPYITLLQPNFYDIRSMPVYDQNGNKKFTDNIYVVGNTCPFTATGVAMGNANDPYFFNRFICHNYNGCRCDAMQGYENSFGSSGLRIQYLY